MDNLTTGDMTLRDWFAGQALAGILANTDCMRSIDNNPERLDKRMRDVIAEMAYTAADAMLERRKP